MCLLHLLRLVLKSVTIPYIPHGQQETANDRNASQDSLSEKWEWVHAQLWLSLCDPMDCSPPGSSVHGISQASILESFAISFFRGFFWPMGWTFITFFGRQTFCYWATREARYSNCCCLVAKSWPTLCDPLDCSSPRTSVHGILQARILEWVAISFSSGSSQPRDWTCVSCFVRQILYHWTTREALNKCVVTTYYFSEMQWKLASPLCIRVQQSFNRCLSVASFMIVSALSQQRWVRYLKICVLKELKF